MNRAAEATWSEPSESRRLAPGVLVSVAVVGLIALSTGVAATIGNGSVVVALAPLAVAWVLWLVCTAPLRNTLCVLMFLGLSVDRPGDSQELWNSSLAFIGGALFQNLNKSLPVDALKFNGMTLAIGLLLAVRAYRVLVGRTRDSAQSIAPAPPLTWSLGVALTAVVVLVVLGLARGGDSQMAKIQVQGFIVLLGAAYLWSVSLRGPRDYRVLATVTVMAACSKAAMALWVRQVLPPAIPDRFGTLREVEYATNHGDSLVFSTALVILLVPFFFRPTMRHVRWLLLVLPLIVAGTIANDRRIAWAQLGASILVMFAMNVRGPLARRALRATILASPLLVAYIVVGWMSPSRIFKPVQTIRSMIVAERVDGSIDRSTLFRDIENYNLVYTFQGNPVIGTGFGHSFVAAVRGDDMSFFKEYYFLPHNAMLGLWAFCGGLGFSALFLPMVIGLFLAIRAHARSRSTDIRMAANVAISSMITYLLHVYADIGFTEPSAIFLVGGALAIAGQLATETGAWPTSGPSIRTAT